MNDDELTALIRSRATRHSAGERLRAAVRTQIALQTVAREPAAVAPRPPGRWRRMARADMLASFVSGAALTLALVWVVPQLALPQALPAELVADHVRALKSGALIEVASSDRHTVKPWFQGRLDYAPQVIDLASEGFPLLGGRVERVAGAPTAALTYARRQHMVSVFVWPSEREQAPQRTQRSGFNILHWSDGAMQVWLVSDAEAGELERFGRAWRAQATPR